MNITIDGPAGAGKSTVARRVAESLGYRLLDTGAMYRSVALVALREGVQADDAEGLIRIARGLRFGVDAEGRMRVDGALPGPSIRTAEVSAMTSRISVHGGLRDVLVGAQRDLVAAGGFVLEGRDTGTVVCPDAGLKLFMTASLEARARRRLGDYEAGTERLESVIEEIRQRDERDAAREVAPLRAAEDAVILDTSEMTLPEVVEEVLRLVETRAEVSQGH